MRPARPLAARRFPPLLAAALALSATAGGAEPLWGFTNFPPVAGAEAAAVVHALTVPASTLYAQHMDQCLPWHAALTGAPFPAWLQADLAEIRRFRAPHQAMYVAITPTDTDRQSLAPACGPTEGETIPLPAEIAGRALDDPAVARAFLAYARRIFDALEPGHATVGIEISELALRAPEDWPAFARLFATTRAGLAESHPQVRVGMELVLQSLLVPRVAGLVKPAAESGDFIGISFYPYGGAFGELFGAPPLPPPPEEWRAPLAFLRGWTDRPVAIAETGYASAPLRIDAAGGIDFGGDPGLQAQFLADLVAEARAQDWPFVVWFVAADYTRLYRALETQGAAAEWMKIWMHAGLWDSDLAPKPALAGWPVQGQGAALPPGAACLGPGSALAPASGPQGQAALAWTVTYAGAWELCALPLPAGLAQARGVSLTLRSAPADLVLVQVEEADGDRFYGLVQAPDDWAAADLPWAALTRAPEGEGGASGGDGRLDPGAIVRLMVGDGAGAEGARGSRRIELTLPAALR
jgi:hypothetical protein